jgi:hypothetical protein
VGTVGSGTHVAQIRCQWGSARRIELSTCKGYNVKRRGRIEPKDHFDPEGDSSNAGPGWYGPAEGATVFVFPSVNRLVWHSVRSGQDQASASFNDLDAALHWARMTKVPRILIDRTGERNWEHLENR